MKIQSFTSPRTISACLVTLFMSWAAFAQSGAQTQEKSKPNISEAEAKAANAINSAPNPEAKLTAAEAFVKKYPKSAVRLEVLQYVAGEIPQASDPAQELALAERFQKAFPGEEEQKIIRPVVINAYVGAKRIDDAFNLAATVLAQQPDHISLLSMLALAGTEEAKRQNLKYVTQTQQYGLKAIEIIEADKKPASISDAAWANQKTMLPRLYQVMGIVALLNGNRADGKARLEKAIALNPTEPFSYIMMGSIVNEDYQQLAQTYKSMPDSKLKQDTLKKATELLDQVIDVYAHAVAAAEGKPEFQQLREQVLQDLTTYYKYRNNQSTDGLQQLIDKYKAPAKPLQITNP